MEVIGEGSTGPRVPRDEPFGRLYRDFGAAVGMGVVCRCDAVLDAPCCQEVSCGMGGEFRSPVRRERLRDAVR